MQTLSEKTKSFILFVDDETKALKYFHKLFNETFNVLIASHPQEAVEILAKRSGEIGVIISDQKMPEKTGVNLLTEVRERYPHIVRILTTAYSDLESNIDAINKSHVFGYITKPWDPEEVKEVLTRALHEYESRKNYLALSASIAHEMRNPLNSIRQSTKIVKDKLANAHSGEKFCEELQEAVIPIPTRDFHEIFNSNDIAFSSAKRGNVIIDVIMNSIRQKPLDVHSFQNFSVSEVLNLVMQEYAFGEGQRNRTFIDVKPEDDFIIRCNDTLLSYIFFNLLKNSFYYFNTHPNLTVTIRAEVGYDKFDRIYFRDNGPGIPEHIIDNIFEFFSTSGKEHGTGLGLAFCKRTMKSFGGTITCISKENEFTEFVLSFPKTIKRKRSFETANCILLVDNQKANLLTAKKLIEGHLESVSCTSLENGFEAINRLKHYHYDLILMDIEMPEINGIETVKKIREFDKETPIIAYSSADVKAIDSILIEAGFNAFLNKTARKEELLRTISKWGIIPLTKSLKSDEEIAKDLEGKKILFADDDSVNLFLTKHQLEKYHTEVEIAKNGVDALDMALWEKYDLILMDISMPEMDGITATKKIRESEIKNNKKPVPIIAFTGDNSRDKIWKIMEAGFNDYFIKGQDHKELVEKMAFFSKNDELK